MFGNLSLQLFIFGIDRMKLFDLERQSLRELNAELQKQSTRMTHQKWKILNPNGSHAIAVGINSQIEVNIEGSAGYYCGGMNQKAKINIEGSVGPGVAENMMSGQIVVDSDASQYAGATGNGGLLVIKGNASSRCGISMKGINIVVHGDIGHMSAFMGQSGNLVVCGNAGDGLGDSLYEARIFVKGSVKSLGTDCVQKEMREKDLKDLRILLQKSFSECNPEDFKRYGSSRKLYNFNVDRSNEY